MRTTNRAALLFFVAGFAGLAGAACSTTRAAAPVERPALDVPPPPPRVIVPLPTREPQPLEPVENLAPIAPAASKPRPPREKEAPKPDPVKPEETVKPLDPPPAEPPAPAPVQPAPQLRMPDGPNSPQLGQIKDTIGRAKGLLDKVNRNRLNSVDKKAFMESDMFRQQADDALKANNLALAKELADKAERLAIGLQGR